jgi:hypothetical protein
MKRPYAVLSLLVLSGCLTSMPSATPSNDSTPETSSNSDAKASDASKTKTAADQKPARQPLKRVVGYFPDWTHGRSGSCKYTVDEIDPMLFTHLNFAFARVDGGDRKSPTFKLAPFDKTDLGPDGQYAHFVALKKKNPKLKTLLSVGGWTHSDPPYDWIFSTMAETPEGRKQFIDSAIKYLRPRAVAAPSTPTTTRSCSPKCALPSTPRSSPPAKRSCSSPWLRRAACTSSGTTYRRCTPRSIGSI